MKDLGPPLHSGHFTFRGARVKRDRDHDLYPEDPYAGEEIDEHVRGEMFGSQEDDVSLTARSEQ